MSKAPARKNPTSTATTSETSASKAPRNKTPHTKTIVLFGASGGTGRAIVEQALARGHKVRGVERDPPHELSRHERFEALGGDLLEGGLEDVMEGADLVISAVGIGRDPQTLLRPPPLYSGGAVNIIRAMRKVGLERLVTISAAFADPEVNAPAWFKAATFPLDRIFRQMGDMERVLGVCEDIEWTAVRPGWLLDRGLTREYSVALDNLPSGTLRTRREDLAHFMLECAENGLHIRETPFIARSEGLTLESPPALIEELLPF
ncbi:MAG: NAD(P)H-binding protein [Erythrobacter sp.]|jgi:nucleoside-diphosphate-sugar epimerase|nr:NAD(P)H-binding protein [Erythrobacter sp.]